GFKAVKDSDYVDLQPLTLFIGRNGSGKSSLVEALQWMQDAYFDDLLRATDSRFRAFSYLLNKRSHNIKLHLEFESTPKPVYYDLDVKKAAGGDRPIVSAETVREGQTSAQERILWTTKGRKGPVFRNVKGANPERNGNRLAVRSLSQERRALRALAAFIEGMVVLRLSPTMMRFESPLERAEGRLLDEEGTLLPSLLSSFSADQRRWVRECVARVLPGVGDLKVAKTDRAHGYVVASEQMTWRGGSRRIALPSWMLSEGTRRITALFALLAARPRPSLLIIEEIENGLDPWTLELVFQALRDAAAEGTQVILTTHSPFLLDHVRVEEVVHVQRIKGDSTYTAIRDYSDVVQFEDAVAPGAMYIAGYFGRK
ncbi:MAG TPA: ATP-binding protein, partial [Kofleriaceae bacterium]|nr:ATP-binding protein [Kofleriaceae bacterium]